jgi:hypothetical protein
VKSPFRSHSPALFVGVALASCLTGAAPPSSSPIAAKPIHHGSAADPAAWKAIEALIDQQKYQEAVDLVDKRIAAAKSAGDDTEWAKALI